MPELPEVETVKNGLEPILKSATIISAKTMRKNLRFDFPEDFAKKITGAKITELSRRAKYLCIHLNNGKTIISHLGMSGSWRYCDKNFNAEESKKLKAPHYHKKSKQAAHDHFIMDVKTMSGKIYQALYNDPRRFGFMQLVETAKLNEDPFIAKLGIEPTGNVLSGSYLQQKFKNKKASLKSALLDQAIIAGLGNIYVCEALWRSQLSPLRAAKTLADNSQFAREYSDILANTIKNVIQEAIKVGGSTLHDHMQPDGNFGLFQHNFAVYGKENQPCPQCGTMIKRIIQSGRPSFYCALCQK